MCTEESHTKALEVNDGYLVGCSFYEEEVLHCSYKCWRNTLELRKCSLGSLDPGNARTTFTML